MKKVKIVKWIFIVYALMFVLQFIPVLFFQIRDSFDKTEYATSDDMELSNINCNQIGQEYRGYVAKDGFILYEITASMTNHSGAEYMITSGFTYRSDGTFDNGFKGGTYSQTTNVYEMEECTVIYTNCPEYNSDFGYSAVTVIPGGCTITHRDIVEVPQEATHINLNTIYLEQNDMLLEP